MAKIHGIEIKGVKTFLDHEGARIAQGNIYVEGKKVAEWSQDSWGGCDIYRMCNGYSEKAFCDAIKRVHTDRKKFKSCGQELEIDYDADILMGELLKLNEEEKTFKKFTKDGYKSICTVTDGYHVIMYGIRGEVTESIKNRITNQAIKDGMAADSLNVACHASLDDFIVGEPIRLDDIKKKD